MLFGLFPSKKLPVKFDVNDRVEIIKATSGVPRHYIGTECIILNCYDTFDLVIVETFDKTHYLPVFTDEIRKLD